MRGPVQSRRGLLTGTVGLAVAGALPAPAAPPSASESSSQRSWLIQELSLAGEWAFRPDPDGSATADHSHQPELPDRTWTPVIVPHTWQVMQGAEEYRGLAWYRRKFAAPKEWESSAVRVEFEAVFHSATVWVNGALAGRHLRKGYTSFILDLTSLLRFGAENVIAVQVDNSFNESMLPRGRSSDWAHDGGIYRPVRLIITAPVFIERVAVDAVPHFTSGAAARASVEIRASIRSVASTSWQGQLGCRILDDSGDTVLEKRDFPALAIGPGETRDVSLAVGGIDAPRLWHFDRPHLYTAKLALKQEGSVLHELDTTFGIRTIEARDAGIFLNGERVRLMGVERMAGSNPEFGMAEPAEWIAHDHDDLKDLNCVLSRVHWQQDRRVLDYCDRQGILLQSKIPAGGHETFQGMGPHPLPELMQNGLEQLREMIERDRNHPAIVSWGLCNEIDGRSPPASEFARRLYAEAKKLDPRRLCSHASNTWQDEPGSEVSGLMDFIECNEYFGTWSPGTPEDLRRSLQEVHRAFPDKPIVISEYGYCACVPERPEGDARRIEVLRDHTRVCRELDFVAGLIFFSYND